MSNKPKKATIRKKQMMAVKSFEKPNIIKFILV